eukprot:TRINITY_DN851_c0_g1_i1.p1 TRINITY_DN851_c0_g1~~TRINITY_DN851_c0_g1_i1.p1  ORF type:complete len:193 (+),score=40.86 TRINITY_DN851_c0_g1_i1:33-581(+)
MRRCARSSGLLRSGGVRRGCYSLQTRSYSSGSNVNQSNPSSTNEGKQIFKIGRFNHVAIAVPDLEKSTDMYRNILGAQVSDPVPVPEHGVTTVFVDLGNTKIELIHPLGDKSPIAKFLQKNASGGIHHICLEVDDIRQALTQVQKSNIRVLDPEPKIGAHGKPVFFVHPKDMNGVLVEFEQK